MDGEENNKSFDEILQDPKYQAEFDKRVQKALEKNKANTDAEVQKKLEEMLAGREEEMRKNIQEEIEAKQKEAEELAKMTEAEKYKKLLDQKEQESLAMKKRLEIIDRQEKINKYVEEKGYSSRVLKLVNAASITDAEIESKVDEMNATLSEVVSTELNEKLKEVGDEKLGKAGGKGEGPQFNFGFTPIKPDAK